MDPGKRRTRQSLAYAYEAGGDADANADYVDYNAAVAVDCGDMNAVAGGGGGVVGANDDEARGPS